MLARCEYRFLPGHCLIYELNQATSSIEANVLLFFPSEYTPNYVMDAVFVMFGICSGDNTAFDAVVAFDYLIQERKHKMVEFCMHATILI